MVWGGVRHWDHLVARRWAVGSKDTMMVTGRRNATGSRSASAPLPKTFSAPLPGPLGWTAVPRGPQSEGLQMEKCINNFP